MATYATYRHVELDRVGLGKRRVLKPPGGGSSIVFDEDEQPMKGKVRPSAPQAPVKEVSTQQATPPKPETNGTASSPPDSPATTIPPTVPAINGLAINGTATNGSATDGSATNGSATNGSASSDSAIAINGSATNGSATSGSDVSFPPINGTAMNGSGSTVSMSQGSPSSRSSPSTPSTPSSARQDTQNRLFGAEPSVTTPSRRGVRDHHRSNIFTAEDNASRHSSNGTSKPAAPAVASEGLGEKRAPEQPKTQRQRVPPGGFSTQLW